MMALRAAPHATAPAEESAGPSGKVLTLKAPRFGQAVIQLRGVPEVPYVQLRFGEKPKLDMIAKMKGGDSIGKKRRAKGARDFDADYQAAFYRFPDGGCGQPASAYRNALISACRLAGFPMTMAKLSVFIEADGRDVIDGTPLVRLEGEPQRTEMPARNATGVMDIRVRPAWYDWRVALRVRWDLDQFSEADIGILIMRAGLQVGIGEGRPDSRTSRGMGWGLFEIAQEG